MKDLSNATKSKNQVQASSCIAPVYTSSRNSRVDYKYTTPGSFPQRSLHDCEVYPLDVIGALLSSLQTPKPLQYAKPLGYAKGGKMIMV